MELRRTGEAGEELGSGGVRVECMTVEGRRGLGEERLWDPPQPPARLSQPGPRVVGWSGVREGGRLAQYRTLSPPTRPPPPPLPLPPPLATTQLRLCVILLRSACGWEDPTLSGRRRERDLLTALPQAFSSRVFFFFLYPPRCPYIPGRLW